MANASAILDSLEAETWRDLYRCRYDREHREAILPILAKLLGDPDVEIHQRALRAVGRIGACDTIGALSTLVPLVCAYTRDANPLTRGIAIGVLYGIGRDNPDAAVPALVNASSDTALLDTSLLALISMGTRAQDAIPCFQRFTSHPKGKVRRLALRGLGSTNASDANSLSIISAAIRDRNQEVRKMAQKVLSRIETQA